jgi:hypothetical protein
MNIGNQKLNAYLVEQSITKGKTTKQQLIEKLGPPQTVTKNANMVASKVDAPPMLKAAEIGIIGLSRR